MLGGLFGQQSALEISPEPYPLNYAKPSQLQDLPTFTVASRSCHSSSYVTNVSVSSVFNVCSSSAHRGITFTAPGGTGSTMGSAAGGNTTGATSKAMASATANRSKRLELLDCNWLGGELHCSGMQCREFTKQLLFEIPVVFQAMYYIWPAAMPLTYLLNKLSKKWLSWVLKSQRSQKHAKARSSWSGG